jgi:uncharacterized protein YeaO (DUF488 family)
VTIRVKRVYDEPERADGRRILVDRLWPRGLTTKGAHVDLWLKEVAPSRSLRRWFGHDPKKWEQFKTRYFDELVDQGTAVARLRAELRKGTVTLLCAARDTEHNNAVALKEYFGAQAIASERGPP